MWNILLHIYGYSAAWCCLYFLFTNILVRYYITKGLSVKESVKNQPIFILYLTINEGPFYFGIVLAFLPVVNTVFSVIFLDVMYLQIRHWWYLLGGKVVKKMNQGKLRMKHFRTNELVISIFFKRWMARFYDETLSIEVNKFLKKKKNEKGKSEFKSDSEPYADEGDQKVFKKREEAHPDRGAQ